MKILLEKKKVMVFLLFIIYILIILRLTIFRSYTYSETQLSLLLFIDLVDIYKNIGMWQFLRLFIGNIGWFIPFGFLLSMLLKKSVFFKVVMFGLAFSFVIEMLQFILRKGVAELDDLILNVLGAIIGYFLYRFLSIKKHKKS